MAEFFKNGIVQSVAATLIFALLVWCYKKVHFWWDERKILKFIKSSLINCILFTTQLHSKLTSRCKSIGPLVAANLPLEPKLYPECEALNVRISKLE